MCKLWENKICKFFEKWTFINVLFLNSLTFYKKMRNFSKL